MKVLCKHCLNPCKKIGRVECSDYTVYSIDELTKELNKLKVSGDNPIKQKELQTKLDYFHFGIKC